MIEGIRFDTEICEKLGLHGGNLRGLRDLVVLTGPNGHGKSRYLKALTLQLNVVQSNLQRLLNGHDRNGRKLEELSPDEFELFLLNVVRLASDKSEDAQALAMRPLLQERMSRVGVRLDMYQSLHLSASLGQWIRSKRRFPRLVHVGHSPLAHVHDLPLSGLTHRATRYLCEIAKRIYMRRHPQYALEHSGRLVELDSFQQTLRGLLGVEVECRDIDDVEGSITATPYLFGRKFELSELSKGQQILLGWAILIHQEVGTIKDSILLFDEPELHLHPEVCIRAIDRLRTLGAAQIWVATHCLPFLAYAGADRIFAVENGTISYAGNRIVETQGTLVGGAEGRERLRTFLADADAIAVATYAAQCLAAPESVAAREGDPQPEMMRSWLQGQLAGGRPVRVLEFAAGQGRIAQALAGMPDTVRANVCYYAYNDPEFTSPEERDLCRQRVEALGQSGSEPFCCESLRPWQVAAAAKMDAVLMCNVLHEILHDEWIRVFKDVAEVLSPSGRLLVMEDQRMSVGELPHAKGFLVLDRVEMAELFGTTVDVLQESVVREGRLTLLAVPRDRLTCVTADTIRKAIESLAKRALGEVKKCRRAKAQGRDHAYFTMLYANARMALEAYV